MTDGVERFLGEWHRVVASRDVEALPALLGADASLGAPPYWNRIEGREVVAHLLGLILENIEGFTYHREWRRGRELALEFTGRAGGLDLQGIDLISLDASGAIGRLDVLMRPVNAVVALRESIAPRMTEFLARRAQARS